MKTEYTVTEVSFFNEESDEEELRLTTDPMDSDYPVDLRCFDQESDKEVLDTSLSRSECRELRDFLNSLDLD